jgi:hypothetical protein
MVSVLVETPSIPARFRSVWSNRHTTCSSADDLKDELERNNAGRAIDDPLYWPREFVR